MNGWLVGLVLLPVALAETGELSPWLARRCLLWGSRRLRGRFERERYAEEWCADLDRIPGKVTKLGYAVTVVMVSVPWLRWRAWLGEREVPGMRAASLRAAAALETAADLDTLATLIASGAVATLGFRTIAVNIKVPGERLRCFAAIGPQVMVDRLADTECQCSVISELLSQATPWGTLRLLRQMTAFREGLVVYIPDSTGSASGGPNAWHADDGTLAPLYGTGGELLGLLSMDEPISGCIPGPAHLAAIEAYAAHAAHVLATTHQKIEPHATEHK